MQRHRVTHAAKCSSSQSIIRELFRRKGERADYWKKQGGTIRFPPTNMGQNEWRNSFTKNTPLRVKLKLNISAVKRKQANTMQWHQFPGVPGILLTTLSWGWPGTLACTHTPFKNITEQKDFSLQTSVCAIKQKSSVGTVIPICWILILHQYLAITWSILIR